MKNHKRAKGLLIAGSLCVLTFVLFGSRLHSVFGGSSPQTPQTDERKVLIETLRRDGLRGAAKLKGHYIADFNPHWDFGLFDIESLTKDSAAVVVGVAGRNLGGHLTEGGLVILTNYEVMVQEDIKGQVIEGSTIIVSLPGGSVQFEDGTTAELRTPTFEHVKTGGTYTFFLTEVEKSPGVYTPTGGPQGLVEIVDNASVKSRGRDTDPIAQQTRGKDKQSFLKDVREQAKKWPNKGKCCS
jgi:hypothetical protein